MDCELITQKVLNSMTCIRQSIDRSKMRIREFLGSSQPHEAEKEYKKLQAFEFVLEMLEEDFAENKEV